MKKENINKYKQLQYKHFAEELLLLSNETTHFCTTNKKVQKILKKYGKNSYEFSKLYLRTHKTNTEQLFLIPPLVGSIITGLLTTASYESITNQHLVIGIILAILGIMAGTCITILWTLRCNRQHQITYKSINNWQDVITILTNFCNQYETNIMNIRKDVY